MADVFISYAREDKPFVGELAAALAGKQRDVWVDLDDILPSEAWRQAIYRGIEDADAIVVVLSPDWIRSGPCQDELAYAARHNKRLIPILCRDVEGDAVPETLASLNWIPGLPTDDRGHAVDLLLQTLEADPEWVRAHTRLVTLAGEWERQGRASSQLLRGDNLQRAEAWLARAATIQEPKPTELQSAYILASQRDQRRGQRIWIGFLSGALVVTLALGIFALIQRNDAITQSNEAIRQSNVRATAEAVAIQEAYVRATAEADAISAANARATAQTIAEEQQRIAEDRRKLALSGMLAAQSADHLDDNYALALLLAVQAYQVAPTIEAKNSLFTALEYSPHLQTFLRGHVTEIHSVAVSPDGRKVAAGALLGDLLVWDLTRGEPPAQLRGMSDQVNGLAFSPDGQVLASGHGMPGFGRPGDATLGLWDVSSGKLDGEPLRGRWGAVQKVSFSPDRKTLLSVNSDETATLWDLASRQPIRSFTDAGAASLSTDGTRVAIGRADGEIRVLDIASGVVRQVLPAVDERTPFVLSDLVFSPSGASILVTSPGRAAIRPVDPAAVRGPVFTAYGVAISPDGSVIAAGNVDGTITLRNGDNFAERDVRLAGHTYAPSSLAFTRDSTHLVSGGLDTNVIVWDLAADHRLGTVLDGLTGEILDFDGRLVLWKDSQDRLGLWDVATRRPVAPPVATDWETGFDVGPIRDGHALACTIDGHDMLLWDLATGQQRGPTLSGHSENVVAAALSLDGTSLASSSRDGAVILWDLASTPTSAPLPSPTEVVDHLTFSPDGRLVIGHDASDQLTFWDTTTRQRIPAPVSNAMKVLFSPDGRILALAGSTGLTLWDLSADQKLKGPLPSVTTNIGRRPLAFSPDGRLLAWGSDDTTFTVWDVANARQLAPPISGHRIDVAGVVFSPDSTLLATTDMGGDSIVWDLATLQPIGPTLQSPYSGKSFAFAPDGRSFIAGRTADGLVLWDLDVEHWLVQACTVVRRDLTDAEWRQYLGDEPRQETCKARVLDFR